MISKKIISQNPLKESLVIKNDNNHFTLKQIIAIYPDTIDFLYKENIVQLGSLLVLWSGVGMFYSFIIKNLNFFTNKTIYISPIST